MSAVPERYRVVPVRHLDMRLEPEDWVGARQSRDAIAAYFEAEKQLQPKMWNGRVLILASHRLEGEVLTGRFRQTDFASLLWWLRHDCPDRSVRNCFAMAALRAADGAFLLGRMAAWTANAGKVYFAAGTPDLDDVRADGVVDLAGSMTRELAEETGLAAPHVAIAPEWSAVMGETRLALMRTVSSPLPADALAAHIRDFLRLQAKSELDDMVIVRGPGDLTPSMPPFIHAYLLARWGGQSPSP